MTPWFWSRPLLPAEWALLDHYFGAPVHPAWRRMRVHVRRLGDTRRALSFNGGFLSFPRHCFVEGDPHQPLRIAQPLIAGWLAHEAFHHWQRLQGKPVTRHALWLQWRYWQAGDNPYCYPACSTSQALLAQFQSANVEQQAQMWQDAVMAGVASQQTPLVDAQYAALQGKADAWQPVLQWVQAQG